MWFRRQVVLYGFIVEFFAPAARLVVEVDGALAAAGLRVLRLPA